MDGISEIWNLMENRQFEEAEKLLMPLYSQNRRDPMVNYLLGLFYNYYDNPKKSKDEATRHFQKAASSDFPIENAFYELAMLERNREKSARILKQGIMYYPESELLYDHLLCRTERCDREVLYKEIANKGISTLSIDCTMIETRFDMQDFAGTISLIANRKTTDPALNFLLRLVKGACLLSENNLDSERIFKEIIEEDICHGLNHMAHFGLTLFYLKSGLLEDAVKIFCEIPMDTSVDPCLMEYPLHVSFVDYMLKAISDIETGVNDRKVVARARGIRGLFLYNQEAENSTKVIRDLEFCIKIFPGTVSIVESLISIYTDKGKPYQAFEKCINYIDDYYYQCSDLSYCFIDNLNDNDLLSVVQEIKTRIIKMPEKITRTIFDPLIERLYNDKQYKVICSMADIINEKLLLKTNVIFEIAYSYNELTRKSDAKHYYSALKAINDSSAVSNNLGIIFEDEGYLEIAADHFSNALKLDPNNKSAPNNLKRVKEKAHQQAIVDLENKKSAESFFSETIFIQNKLYKFAQHRSENGYVICPYKQLPAMFNVSAINSNEVLNSFLKKKYLIKRTNHLPTNSSVYEINPEILKELDLIESNIKNENELLSVAEKINLQNMEKLGYNKELLTATQKVNSQELQIMLARDLKESVVALLSGSFKSSLILCGSIVEAVLLDKITANGITHYKMEDGKTKSVNRMVLSDLLLVASQENLIQNQLYHFCHAIRGYRNIIHPGLEARKQAVVVNEDNANMAWDIARKVLLEI
ncbi:hypothetical protein AXX12_18585 [Anaerosporomusa subterranea]|uniref:Uncharacterized protein n=1 Tax=Anaerosporomusa subterranea TaxID=1794912 RepID=A0A154BLK2_ANASB|nr:hypothetical protein [Anaerosporomusa subterranea]KYZ74849.1 hypothetical protein AXX12_18585 [Anaerosporomusa subterranea]